MDKKIIILTLLFVGRMAPNGRKKGNLCFFLQNNLHVISLRLVYVFCSSDLPSTLQGKQALPFFDSSSLISQCFFQELWMGVWTLDLLLNHAVVGNHFLAW